MWGPVISGVLFRLNGLGLWPNDPVRGHRRVRERSTKVEAEMVLQEELKVIYDRPKPIRGESHLGIFIRGGLKLSYPPEYSFKGTL